MKRRDFLKTTAAVAAVGSKASALFGQDAPSNTVRIAVMGCRDKGSRGMQLTRTLLRTKGVEVAGICDVDSRGLEGVAKVVEDASGKKPKINKDIRHFLDDKEIDGIVCAAPDHWHAPVSLMAMKAGKGIYVEKPCAHNPAEGEILVEAAKKYGQVFQMGNQRRSSGIYRTLVNQIHNGLIGKTRYARCWYTSGRGTIGRGKEVPVPEWLDWELWQGPAPRRPFKDNIVHYTWHWYKHWGTGESGNNATHYVDIARWALGAKFPTKVTSGGGRLLFDDDDWEFADSQMATFEFPDRQFLIWEGLSSTSARPYEDIITGCMIYGQNGSVLFSCKSPPCVHFDRAGNVVKEYTYKDAMPEDNASSRTNPTAGLDVQHIGNWTDGIRDKNQNTNSPADESAASVLLVNLANIAYFTKENIYIDPQTGKLAKGSAGADMWGREYEKGWEMKL